MSTEERGSNEEVASRHGSRCKSWRAGTFERKSPAAHESERRQSILSNGNDDLLFLIIRGARVFSGAGKYPDPEEDDGTTEKKVEHFLVFGVFEIAVKNGGTNDGTNRKADKLTRDNFSAIKSLQSFVDIINLNTESTTESLSGFLVGGPHMAVPMRTTRSG